MLLYLELQVTDPVVDTFIDLPKMLDGIVCDVFEIVGRGVHWKAAVGKASPHEMRERSADREPIFCTEYAGDAEVLNLDETLLVRANLDRVFCDYDVFHVHGFLSPCEILYLSFDASGLLLGRASPFS